MGSDNGPNAKLKAAAQATLAATKLKRAVRPGLPEVTAEEAAATSSKVMKILPMFVVIPKLIGLAIAYAVFTFGSTSLYESQMSLVASVNAGYLYVCALILSVLVGALNTYPMLYKEPLKVKGNIRANMIFYKMAVEPNEDESKPKSPYIVMEDEGSVGALNRANRSLHHFTENSIPVVLAIALAGFCFPFPTMVATSTFAFGRIWHQVGYSGGGYGKHGAGFGVAMMSVATMDGMVAISAYKCLTAAAPVVAAAAAAAAESVA